MIERHALRCIRRLPIVILFGLAGWVSGGTADAEGENSISRAIYRGVVPVVQFDVSRSLRQLADEAGTFAPDIEDERSDDPKVFHGEMGFDPDGDAAMQAFPRSGDPQAIPNPTVSFDGPQNPTTATPPDPVGDVGPNHYVLMYNSQFAIYSKVGVLLTGPADINTIWAGFTGPCQDENSGDPVVLYDPIADRWLITQFTADGPTYFNCVALSTTSDPSGTYYRWAFTTGTNFPDYPKYGVWPDAYYISTREFAGAPFAGVGAYAVDRAQMVSGNPSPTMVSFLAPPGGRPTTSVTDFCRPISTARHRCRRQACRTSISERWIWAGPMARRRMRSRCGSSTPTSPFPATPPLP